VQINSIKTAEGVQGEGVGVPKWQKCLNSSFLPFECPWSISSATQMAESPEFKQIAAEVPLEFLQRHSNGRKP